MKNKRLLGAHMSIAGGIHNAIKRGKQVGCTTIQIFSKSSNRWQAKPITPEEIAAYEEKQQASGIAPVIVHNSYLINLASPDEQLYQKSIEALGEEMLRAELLGSPNLVIHPGSHVGSGEEVGLRRIAAAINQLHKRHPGLKVMITLETTAGQGSCLGYSFQQFVFILERVKEAERVGICLDTCHIFAAGYELRTRESYHKNFDTFDKLLGIERLKVIHLNDSKYDFGSYKDRHEHIGKGFLGQKPFKFLLNDHRLIHLPMILETPREKNEQGEEMDVVNLKLLHSLIE